VAPPHRTLLTFAPLLVGIAALLGVGALGGRIAPAEAALWRIAALQFCWVGIATATAGWLGGSVRERLGFAPLALGGVGLLALSGALEFAIAEAGLRGDGALARLDALVEAAGRERLALVLLATAVAPGFGEELLFRGLLQRGLARRAGAWAIPLAGLAFAVVHEDRVLSPAAFALGCYLGGLAWLTGSTWTAIVCHVANNATASAQSLLALPLPAPASQAGAIGWALTSAACLGVLVRLLRKSGVNAPSA
jgi:membrane protease YdiL (CAAX protease family)